MRIPHHKGGTEPTGEVRRAGYTLHGWCARVSHGGTTGRALSDRVKGLSQQAIFSKMTPVASWVAHEIDGATTSLHNTTTMATAVEALGVELGTPRKAANEAGSVARDSLVIAAHRARAADAEHWCYVLTRRRRRHQLRKRRTRVRLPPSQGRNCTNGQSWARRIHPARVVRKGVVRRNDGGSHGRQMETTRTSPFQQSEGTKPTGKIKRA